MTTATAPMYTDQVVRFRDPFASSISPLRHSQHNDVDYTFKSSWSFQPSLPTSNKALTPPADMNGLPQGPRPHLHQQEYGQHYSDRTFGQQASRAPVAPYIPREHQQANVSSCHTTTSRPGRGTSPARSIKAEIVEEAIAHAQPKQAQPAANPIAVNFQIPRSVNDSGGSLSELAAQVSCLARGSRLHMLIVTDHLSVLVRVVRASTAD